jgi:hypothetical protein
MQIAKRTKVLFHVNYLQKTPLKIYFIPSLLQEKLSKTQHQTDQLDRCRTQGLGSPEGKINPALAMKQSHKKLISNM